MTPTRPSNTALRQRTAPAKNAEQEDLVRTSGTARRSNADRIVDLFGFPGLVNFSEALDHHRASKHPQGRRPTFPALALLATTASARITGSTASALTELQSPTLWARCRDAYYQLTQVDLADRAPTRDHIRAFRSDIAVPETMDALATVFTIAAIGQARLMGNLIPGQSPDWASPDPRHVIFGDGTIVSRYSDAEIITCPLTDKRVLNGSRARRIEDARVQKVFRTSGEDGKNSPGINNVALHTRTPHGLIVLACDLELGAEHWAALNLLDLVARFAGDGVHTLVYDGAITGWAVEYAMAVHGIQVMGTVPAASDKTDSHTYTAEQIESYIANVVQQLGPERASRGRLAKVLRSDILGQMYRGERATPVGTSIYPSRRAGRVYDLVHGTYLFTTAAHTTGDGARCEHTLVQDDGAMFTVTIDPISELLVKDEYLPAITSVRHPRARGRWGATTTFLVPCGAEDFSWTVTWDPADTRYHPDSTTENRAPAAPFGWRLRAVPRFDRARFAVVNGSRNDSESFNNWYKDTLTNKRAASIDYQGQRLDQLLAAVVKNCDTWTAFTTD